MTRKNIFEILNKNVDIQHEIKKISKLLETNTIIKDKYQDITVLQTVNMYSFIGWKQRNRYINSEEMMSKLDIRDIYFKSISLNEAIIYLEFAINMIHLCGKAINEKKVSYYADYEMLYENIVSLVEHLNMEIKIFEKEEKVIIVEKNKAATAVAEIVDDKLGYKVIEYNHYLLKGDIAKKKDILNALASKLEPEKTKLETLDKTLSDNFFFLCNNINIRHNNKEKGKSYKEFVAKMADKELEEWYDETYQLALLAILLLDNVPRTKKIKDLKSKIGKK